MMIGPYIRINRGSTEENAYKYKELLRETEKIGIEKARLRGIDARIEQTIHKDLIARIETFGE